MLLDEAKKILCSHKKHLTDLGVRKLSIFGSTARGESKAKSDIDILIDFEAKRGLFGFVELKGYLEEILQCDVDLVTKNALHPILKNQILKEIQHIF